MSRARATRRRAAVAAVAGLAALAPLPATVTTAAEAAPAPPVVIAGGGGRTVGNGGPALEAVLFPQVDFLGPRGAVAVDAVGNAFVVDADVDSGRSVVRRVTTGGIIDVVAGPGVPTALGDGGPATAASVAPLHLAADGAGNLYLGERHRVRRIGVDGVITTVAGTGAPGPSGDGGPAVAAAVNITGLAAAADGTLYLADGSGDGFIPSAVPPGFRIRRVSTAGVITTVAGTGVQGFAGDGGPGTSAQTDPGDLALDGAGNLFFRDAFRIRRLSTGGIVTTVAGNGTRGSFGDGVPALTAQLDPSGLMVDAAGVVTVPDRDVGLRRITADGVIRTLTPGSFGRGASYADGDVLTAAPPGLVRIDSVTGATAAVAGGGRYGVGDGPAVGAFVGPAPVQLRGVQDGEALGPDGAIHFATSLPPRSDLVRRLAGGAVSTVAGAGQLQANDGDGGPAVAANLVIGDVAVAPDGTVLLLSVGGEWIRRIGRDGVIRSQPTRNLNDLEVDARGTVLAIVNPDDFGQGYVAEIGPDGSVRPLVGGGTFDPVDGARASSVRLDAHRLAVGPQGEFAIVTLDGAVYRVTDDVLRRIVPPDPGGRFNGTVRDVEFDALGNLLLTRSIVRPDDTVVSELFRIDPAGHRTSLHVASGGDVFTGLLVERTSAVLRTDNGLVRIDGVAAPTDGVLTPVVPSRLADTRDGTGGVPVGVVPAGGVLELGVAGRVGLAPDAAAVALNVTATGAEEAGFVTVFPCGERPLVSSLNVTAGATVANAVVVPVSPRGTVCFYASQAVHLVVDAAGSWTAGFDPIAPARLVDTRDRRSVVPAGGVLVVPVAGTAGLDGGIGSVALNVTVTEPAADGFLTVYPCGERPLASNVNFRTGQTVANGVLSGVSDEGAVCVYASQPTHVVVDAFGALAWGFAGLPPARLLDTRDGGGPPVGGGGTVELPVVARAGVPGAGVAGVALNVTVTEPASAGFVTVFPCGERPLASNVNFEAGRTVPNLVVVPPSADGRVCLYTSQAAHLVVDVTGWMASAPA